VEKSVSDPKPTQHAVTNRKLRICSMIKGDESLWLITTARIVLSGQYTTIIPNRSWGAYGDGMPDGVPDGRRMSDRLRTVKEMN
jgi:hypothetical protein